MTIADLGARDGLQLHELRSATIGIPVAEGFEPSSLAVSLLPFGGVLRGQLTVLAGERIVARVPVSESTERLIVPLPRLVARAGMVPLTLRFDVARSEPCDLGLLGTLVVQPSSSVRYRGQVRPPRTIADFLPSHLTEVEIHLPDGLDDGSRQAVLSMAAAIGHAYPGRRVPVRLSTARSAEPVIGPWRRTIRWRAGATATVRGGVLELGRIADVQQIFASRTGRAVMPFSSTTVTQPDVRPDSNQEVWSLGRLAPAGLSAVGLDSGVVRFDVSMTEFGRGRYPTALQLDLRHTPPTTTGMARVRVMLNGSLMHAEALAGGATRLNLPIPREQLRRDNAFAVAVDYGHPGGRCEFALRGVMLTVTPQTGFDVADGQPLPAGFARFPQVLGPTFPVVLRDSTVESLQLAVALIGALQATTRRPLQPTWTTALPATGAAIVIGDTTLAARAEAPLAGPGFVLRDRTGAAWLSQTPSSPYAALQAFEANGRDVLLLTTAGPTSVAARLLAESLGEDGWYGVQGDLVLAGPDGPVSSLRVLGGDVRIDPLPAGPPGWWSRYGGRLLAALATVLIIGLLILRPRVVRDGSPKTR